MNKLKIGSIILSVWSSLNFFPSLYVGISILFFDSHPPGLYAILNEGDFKIMSPEMLMTVDSIGLFANLSVAALNLLILVVIWKGLNNSIIWTYWALMVSCVIAILAGVAADYAVNFAFPEVNIVSVLIVAAGFIFSGIGLFKK
ncbi:hypothetical protein [Flagellimonas algicola]|uniref:SPW repeat-containing protein n=1 Tax=Flagellimonas algicola TaxID=2583815 RepID=A0ABY2WFX9_9FLAO|nr:hypothetical protein [Allomuricauda algicola]TMU50439.1 hypothetical protein FGG15_19645 [Allomuricauda algicola]